MLERRLATAVLSALAVTPVHAQEATLPAVTVEATRLLPPSEEAADPGALGGGPAADGGEILRSVPGVWGSRLGGAGIDPTIRGQDETQLNVLLDGGYVHGGCPNRMDPPTAYVAPETYDEVRVIKGSQTVVYGGGGSGGTVLFERNTPRFGPDERLRGKAGAGYRANGDGKEAFADVAAGTESGYARVIGNYADANNYTDGNGDEVRSAYTHTSGTALLGYTPDAATRLELGLETFQGDDILYAGPMDAPETENNSARLRFERTRPVAFLDGLKAEAYYNDVYHLMDNYSLRPEGMMRMRVPSDSVTYGGRVQGELLTGPATAWTVGIDHQTNNREALRFSDMMSTQVDYVQSLMWPDVTTAQTGVFVEMDHDLSDRDRLRVGLRYDRVAADAGRAREAADSGTAPADLYNQYYGTRDDDASEDNVGGLVRYARDLTNRLTLHGTVSRSVRTADATERFIAADGTMMMDAWVGNPAIDPEQHHQVELGATWATRATEISATAYYNRVSDYILTDKITVGGSTATGYRNVDAELFGGEFKLARALGAHWRARATAAYVHGTNTTDDTALPQIPPLEGTVGLSYQRTAWQAGVDVRMVDEQDRVDLASGQDAQKTPGYAVVNLHGEVRLPARLKLKLGVDNLLDKTFAEHINRKDSTTGEAILVNEPGRSVWARVSGRF